MVDEEQRAVCEACGGLVTVNLEIVRVHCHRTTERPTADNCEALAVLAELLGNGDILKGRH